jgi:hypothetical protein
MHPLHKEPDLFHKHNAMMASVCETQLLNNRAAAQQQAWPQWLAAAPQTGQRCSHNSQGRLLQPTAQTHGQMQPTKQPQFEFRHAHKHHTSTPIAC